jgi:hypothetical protein
VIFFWVKEATNYLTISFQSTAKVNVREMSNTFLNYHRKLVLGNSGVGSLHMQNSNTTTSTFQMIIGNFATTSDGSPHEPANFIVGVLGILAAMPHWCPPTWT